MANLRRYAMDSLIRRTNSHECICEALRLVYDLIDGMEDKELKEKITDRLATAFIMGKKMQDRLAYYQEKYSDDTGNKGSNIKRILGSTKRLRMRRERTI